MYSVDTWLITSNTMVIVDDNTVNKAIYLLKIAPIIIEEINIKQKKAHIKRA